jgi:hypothetical protein
MRAWRAQPTACSMRPLCSHPTGGSSCINWEADHVGSRRRTQVKWQRGFHVAAGHSVTVAAYERYLGRWSRLFVPASVAAAEVAKGHRVLDVAPPMLDVASARFIGQRFLPVAADGQALPFSQEFRRVLRARSPAAVCGISSAQHAPQWGILAEILSEYLPAERDVLHLSFALADSARLESLFAAAGFHDIRVGQETRRVRFDSFAEWASRC